MRSLPEWIGLTPDTKVPIRVRLRVLERDEFRCQCGCGRIILPFDDWQTDHKTALINGGENRETNLVTLLDACHLRKTAADVAEKSKVYRIKKKYRGLRKPSRFACSRSSKYKKKISGEVVLRDS